LVYGVGARVGERKVFNEEKDLCKERPVLITVRRWLEMLLEKAIDMLLKGALSVLFVPGAQAPCSKGEASRLLKLLVPNGRLLSHRR